jgi:hypothetical protein
MTRISNKLEQIGNRKAQICTVDNCVNIFSTCQQPGCEAGIREETMEPVQYGAGLKLKAECNIGHKTSFSTCEVFNKGRTSILDVKLSVLQLVIGLNMTQERQQH